MKVINDYTIQIPTFVCTFACVIMPNTKVFQFAQRFLGTHKKSVDARYSKSLSNNHIYYKQKDKTITIYFLKVIVFKGAEMSWPFSDYMGLL